ncbi:uncharacterized protein SCHCODRAFT_02671988 [Schizophyllum commune H4-8]|nr:uncharacterized protein SCHCODRAFT_02671988 [Schizophyllum commune H4-8]KAI5888088.1 hypothetical protein SCHCODRAFT_02671988 [Schizophyllum commune H4-8]
MLTTPPALDTLISHGESTGREGLPRSILLSTTVGRLLIGFKMAPKDLATTRLIIYIFLRTFEYFLCSPGTAHILKIHMSLTADVVLLVSKPLDAGIISSTYEPSNPLTGSPAYTSRRRYEGTLKEAG